MTTRAALIVLLLSGLSARAADDPIRIEGPEQSQLDVSKINGNLPPLPGVKRVEVFRAQPDGYTYNHHVDLAAWKGRLYLAWNQCRKDEDVWPSREVYSTSTDGDHWDAPRELFPMGLSTPIRMFFFHAPNGRMLAIAGLRASREPLVERDKGALFVREIREDHSLGDVHLLIAPRARATTSFSPGPRGEGRAEGQGARRAAKTPDSKTSAVERSSDDSRRSPLSPALSPEYGEEGGRTPPFFRTSSDRAFTEACDQLLANRPFLEQQDYGTALGDRRMKWHDVANWSSVDDYTRGRADFFGKAFSFFHRTDGRLVGIAKLGFVVVSTDDGDTWSPPVRPRSLVTGGAKVWGQRTSDGRYALVYNPHPTERFPLVVVSGEDGITFRNMRVVFGDKPPLRYPGLNKGPGPQYARGISEWSSDGSWTDPGMWVTYSVNKEDIWVSRIPVPVGATAPTTRAATSRPPD